MKMFYRKEQILLSHGVALGLDVMQFEGSNNFTLRSTCRCGRQRQDGGRTFFSNFVKSQIGTSKGSAPIYDHVGFI